jgi:hypothetical protein
MDLIFEEGKVAGPKPLYLFPVPWDEFDELKSLLLQVDQSLGVSQLLLMGTLSNFTLSKRQEMLDKSVDWFKTNLSTGFVPNKTVYVLSQDGYPFPREES